MEMRQLLQVMEIYKTHSIGKAAENLFISQPTLTVSIKQLEAELGEPLFVRSRKGSEMTEFGRKFIRYIAPICQKFGTLDAAVADLKRRSSKELMLSVPPAAVFGKAYALLLKKHRGGMIDSRLKECFANTAISDVELGSSEIAVVAVVSPEKPLFTHLLKIKGLEYAEFLHTPPAISVSRGHPLFERDSVQVEDLQGFSQMIFSDSSGNSMFEDVLNIGGNIDKIYVNSRASLEELLRETGAFGVATQLLERDDGDAEGDIRIIPLVDTGIEVHVGWVKRAGITLGQLAEEYIDLLKSMLAIGEEA